MAQYVRIAQATQLPSAGAFESQFLEFKRRLNRLAGGSKVNYTELAKDIAAFANAYGGTILVGAQERGSGEFAQIDPLTTAEAQEAATGYVHAAESQCFPRVVVDLAQIDLSSGHVLAVNIEPRLDSIVGIRSADNRDAYSFPVRHDAQTKFLNPEQIVVNMIPQVRRTILLLRQIPSTAPVMLEATETYVIQAKMYPEPQHGTVNSINEATNTFQIGVRTYALDRVESVFQQDSYWVIVYRFHGANNRRN